MTGVLAFDGVLLDGQRPTAVTLDVPEHRAVVLVGEVTSRLERLALMALGIERPAGGRALLYGEDVGGMGRRAALAFRRRAGYVPEGDGLLQNLTLEDNVALPLRFGSAMSAREVHGRVRVILGAFGLAEVAHLRPADADDEQRRRAAFARAVVFDPALVLLTQPFDGIGLWAAAQLLDLARGGETPDGPRRSLFVTCQTLPERLRSRFEQRFRVVGGTLQADA